MCGLQQARNSNGRDAECRCLSDSLKQTSGPIAVEELGKAVEALYVQSDKHRACYATEICINRNKCASRSGSRATLQISKAMKARSIKMPDQVLSLF